MHLLWINVTYLLKNVKHGIENDIDSAYGAYIHYTFLNFLGGLMNTLQFKQMINLTVF